MRTGLSSGIADHRQAVDLCRATGKEGETEASRSKRRVWGSGFPLRFWAALSRIERGLFIVRGDAPC